MHTFPFSAMYLRWQVDEEKGDRKFGGCPSVDFPARYTGKYAGDCKTNTMFDGTEFDGIETEET